jgi:hypothetical protein
MYTVVQKQPTKCVLRDLVCLKQVVLTQYHLMKITAIMNSIETLHAAKNS